MYDTWLCRHRRRSLSSSICFGRPVFQVVTTRALPASAKTLRQLPELLLNPLEQPDAILLLRQHCPNITLSDADAAAVAGTCGGNALLLTLMGSCLANKRCTAKVHVLVFVSCHDHNMLSAMHHN